MGSSQCRNITLVLVTSLLLVVLLLGSGLVHWSWAVEEPCRKGFGCLFNARIKHEHTVYPRLDIKDFVKAGPLFDLYMQCLRHVLDLPDEDPKSYFQTASIHVNLPTPSFTLARLNLPDPAPIHGSVLFPIWHRPYLLLVESTISGCARQIALEYPHNVRSTYCDAAKALRLPYWDWSSDPALPKIFLQDEVLVNSPNGPRKIINPLSQVYGSPLLTSRIRNEVNEVQMPKHLYNFTTTRYTNVPDMTALIDKRLQRARLPERTFDMFTLLNGSIHEFSYVGHQRGQHIYSVESLHNAVHKAFNGLMDTRFASFDPIFFLHHAQIDRLFAIWQALYPDSYIGNATAEWEQAVVPDSPLTPFFRPGHREMHTPNSVRHIETLGYTYPELKDENLENSDFLKHLHSTFSYSRYHAV
jgi:tyrosinase